METSSRRLATTSRVYPSVLPFVHSSRRGMKWLPPVLAVVAIGYGVSVYRHRFVERHQATVQEIEKHEIERRRRAKLLLDAYGDRSNLDELQEAMRVYESQWGDV